MMNGINSDWLLISHVLNASFANITSIIDRILTSYCNGHFLATDNRIQCSQVISLDLCMKKFEEVWIQQVFLMAKPKFVPPPYISFLKVLMHICEL